VVVVESDGALERPGLILRTEIRGVAVTARWEHGTLTGDDELVRRVTNLAVWRRLDVADLEPAQVISIAREACAGPIETELVLSLNEADAAALNGADDPRARPDQGSRPPRTT
jgi:hypothetical protein